MQTSTPEPLKPAAGAINCVVAEQQVSHTADLALKGRVTTAAIRKLARDIGEGVVLLAGEEPRGTVEIQLTTALQEDKLNGITTHRWRVDLWKARQRQFLRVPVRKLEPGEVWTPGAKTPSDELSANGLVPLKAGQKLGEFACPHCGLEHTIAPFTQGKLPRTVPFNCRRCTLPFHVQLVDVLA